MAIQMILVRRIIHLAKLYVYSLLFENEPTSIYSHLTRNKKWKLWVGWHNSSLWLLCLCVLCFVFCAASKTIQCSQVSPYFIFWKNENYELCFLANFFVDQIMTGKNTTGKKATVLFVLAGVLECHHISYVEKWKLWDIYLLTLNKKQKMKIMGKGAWLILVVVVSVCVVFCVLCCFQMFLSVTIFHILKDLKIMSYVFWQISLPIKLRLGKITKGKKVLC